MAEFEDGQRVVYKGTEGLASELKGRVGVVTESFRLFDEQRISVRFEGEDEVLNYDVEDFWPFREKYDIENMAEDSVSATLELTDTEAALVRKVIEALNDENRTYAPTIKMEKHVETRRGRRTDA
jgi:hypothetical protein